MARDSSDSGSGTAVLPHWIDDTLRQRAADRGYANSFEGIRAVTGQPWHLELGR